MKRIFKFISWQWNHFDAFDKVIILYGIFAVIPAVITGILLRFEIAAMILGIGLLIIFGGFALQAAYLYFSNQWKTFADENPEDDQEIINRLKGIRR